MIPVKEYDASVMDDNIVEFIDKVGAFEKYIKSFQAINGRLYATREDYKYERVCLLLVDFAQTPAKIYSSNQELINDGLLDANSTASIDELSWETFTDKILANYETRFGSWMLTWYFSIKNSSISILSVKLFKILISSFVKFGIVNFSMKFFW